MILLLEFYFQFLQTELKSKSINIDIIKYISTPFTIIVIGRKIRTKKSILI